MNDRSNTEDLRIRVGYNDTNLPLPIGANFFSIAVQGGEGELVVGYVSPRDVHLLVQAANEGVAKGDEALIATISHRFFISRQGLYILRDQLAEIIDQLERTPTGEFPAARAPRPKQGT